MMPYNPNRNTKEYSMCELTSGGFSKFLFDLKNLETQGYDDDTCDVVKSALENIRNEANTYSGASWVNSIALDFDDFLDAYVNWNGNKENRDQAAKVGRRICNNQMREMRKKWRNQFNKNLGGGVYASEDEITFADSTYSHFETIASEFPDIFKSLRSAVLKYKKHQKKR